MKMDPRHLEILAAIAKAGGLTEGAALLGKSQPSVSRSIAMLEDRVGQPLFEERRRPLKPTELGCALAIEGKKILDARKAASALVESYTRGLSGSVRVAGTPIFMDGVISGVIAEFQSENPNVRIDQSYSYVNDALEELSRDLLDFVIVPVRPNELPNEFQFRQILPGRNVVACRVGHPLTRNNDVKIWDITRYPWIVPPANSPLARDLRTLLDGIDQHELKVGFTGGSLGAVLSVLTVSDSLTILPYSVVYMLKRRNSLVSLPLEIGDLDRHLGIITRRNSSTDPGANRLLKFVESRFRLIRDQMTKDGIDSA